MVISYCIVSSASYMLLFLSFVSHQYLKDKPSAKHYYFRAAAWLWDFKWQANWKSFTFCTMETPPNKNEIIVYLILNLKDISAHWMFQTNKLENIWTHHQHQGGTLYLSRWKEVVGGLVMSEQTGTLQRAPTL